MSVLLDWERKGSAFTEASTGGTGAARVCVNAGTESVPGGTILAIGQSNFNGGYGRVLIYYWNTSLATPDWTLRATINGPNTSTSDNFGNVIDLSYDGNIIAITIPRGGQTSARIRVYEWNGSSYVIRGSVTDYAPPTMRNDANNGTITSIANFGYSMKISGDGSAFVTGLWNSNRALIYRWNGTQYAIVPYNDEIRLGTVTTQTLSAIPNNSRFGHSVDINKNGTVVIIGASINGTTGTNAGSAYAYYWDGTYWIQKGQSLFAEATEDRFGTTSSINGDGNIIAIGALGADSVSGLDAGHVRVFYYNDTNSQWVQLGNTNQIMDIDGEGAADNSGYAIQLTEDGYTVVITSIQNNSKRGHARVWKWDIATSTWNRQGLDIGDRLNDSAPNDYMGDTVSISNDGLTVAMGSNGGGRARIYTPGRLPDPPTNLVATSGNASATISFTPGDPGSSPLSNYRYSIDGSTNFVYIGTITSPITITGLTNGREYTFRLKAQTSIGQSIESEPVTVTPSTIPGNPSSLVSTRAGRGTVQISFTQSSNGGSEILNYKYSTDGTNYITFDPPQKVSPVVISGLTNGVSYTIRLKAINKNGESTGVPTTTITPYGPPTSPTITSVTPSIQSISVNFTAPTDNGGSNVTNYKYATSTDDGNTWSSFTTRSPTSVVSPLVITNLTNGVSYKVKILAINAYGDGDESAPSSIAIPASLPGAPTITSITAGNRSLEISFTAPENDGGNTIKNYQYALSTNNGSTWSSFIALDPISTTSPFLISNLTNGTTYRVKLKAVNDIGAGTESIQSAAVTLMTIPDAPSITSVTPLNESLEVYFTAPVNDGGAQITNYKFSYSSNNGSTFSEYITRTPESTTSPIIISGLTNGTSYIVKLRAVNAAGDGQESTVSTSSIPRTTPTAPVITRVAALNEAIRVEFTAPENNGGLSISNYEYSIDNGSTFISAGTTNTQFIISGLTNNTTYTVILKAVNSGNLKSVASAVSSNVIPNDVYLITKPVPQTPSLGNQEITISWNNTSNLSQYATFLGYKIYYRLDGQTEYSTSLIESSTTSLTGLEGGFSSISINGTSATFSGLTNGSLYKFRVVTILSVDGFTEESDSSSIISAIPISSNITSNDLTSVIVTGHSGSSTNPAVIAVSQTLSNVSGITTVTESISTLINGTTEQKNVATSIIVNLSSSESASIVSNILSSSDTVTKTELLTNAITVNPVATGNIISTLSETERVTAIQVATTSLVDANTSLIQAAASSGVIVDENVAKAVGAADISTRITVQDVTTNTTNVVSSFSSAISDVVNIVSEQKTAIISGAADALLKTAVSITEDNVATNSEKTAAVANVLTAVLIESNTNDNFKNTLVSTITENFPGEVVSLTGDTKTQLISSIPESRIDMELVDDTVPISILVPSIQTIEIFPSLSNQMLIMELDTSYNLVNAEINDSPQIIVSYKQLENGARYFDFGNDNIFILGNAISLFGKIFSLSATANGLLSSLEPSNVVLSHVQSQTFLTVTFTAPGITGSTITGYEYSLDAGVNWISTGNGTNTSFQIPNIIFGDSYTAIVRAISVNELNESAYSNPSFASNTIIPTAASPGRPVFVEITPGILSFTVVFTPPDDGGAPIIKYQYSIDNGTTYIDVNVINSGLNKQFNIRSGIETGNNYIIKLRAVNSEGEGLVATSQSVSPIKNNVDINLNIEINADSTIRIFQGTGFIPKSNIIVPYKKLPVNALYDASTNSGLIELWESSTDTNSIKCQLANASGEDWDFTNMYNTTSRKLAKGLQQILCDAFDCSGVVPFNDNKYKNNSVARPEYTINKDFGRVALSALAHYILGHVNATAAISNDVDFIRSMLSLNNDASGNSAIQLGDVSGGATERYLAWSKFNNISGNVFDWNESASNTDANLSIRLVKTLVKKGLDVSGNVLEAIDVSGAEVGSLASIVSQVLNQDISRIINHDNSERTKNVHQILKFIENDNIYINIIIKKPTITVSNNFNYLDSSYSNELNYTLKITLGPRDDTI